jgi:hypothetical protein
LLFPATPGGDWLTLSARGLLWAALLVWGLSLMFTSVESGGVGASFLHNVNLPSVATGNFSSMYTVSIPAGTTSLVVNISGGTGDADLYVNRGSALTTAVSAAVNGIKDALSIHSTAIVR